MYMRMMGDHLYSLYILPKVEKELKIVNTDLGSVGETPYSR